MSAQFLTLTVPRWLTALALALASATLPMYAGYALHRNALDNLLVGRLEQAIEAAMAEMDAILDQLTAVVSIVEPLAAQACEPPVIQSLQHVVFLHPYVRSAFIARDNHHVCGSFFGDSYHPLEIPLPGPGYLLLHPADPVTPAASSLIYSFPHAPYTINLSAYGETLAKPLRRPEGDFQLLLAIGDAQMDETSRVWETDQTLALVLNRTQASDRHPYRLHGGLLPEKLYDQHREALKSIIGSLLVSGTLVGGIIFTVIFHGGRRLR